MQEGSTSPTVYSFMERGGGSSGRRGVLNQPSNRRKRWSGSCPPRPLSRYPSRIPLCTRAVSSDDRSPGQRERLHGARRRVECMSGTGSRAVLLAQCAPCDAALPGEAMARAGTRVRRCQRCAADAAPLVSGLRQRVGGGPGQVAVAGKGKRTRASGQDP
jgi:hypothetical protein